MIRIITANCWAWSGVARAIDFSLPASRVVCLLERLTEQYGLPEKLRSDNGPEFVSAVLSEWCERMSIEWQWIQRQRPTVGQAHAKRVH